MKTQSSDNSLKSYNRIPDRLYQRSKNESTAVLVVEGESDEKIFRRMGFECAIYVAGGRKNVIDTIKFMADRERAFAVGVIDSDFLDPDYKDGETEDIIPYENADLEGMLVSLGVLKEVVCEIGSVEKIDKHGGPDGIVEFIVREAQYWASIRAQNHREGWGIPLRDYEFLKYYLHNKTSQFVRDSEKLEKRLCQDAGIARSDLEGALNKWSKPNYFSGKDAARVCALMMKSYVGSRGNDDSSGGGVMAMIRLAGTQALNESNWRLLLSNKVSNKSFEWSQFLSNQNKAPK